MTQLQHNLSQPLLTKMLQSGKVFCASQSRPITVSSQTVVSSGYPALDRELGGGLGYGCLHEIQLPRLFVGENQLWQHALAYADKHAQPVFWVNPPAQPYIPGMQARSALHTVVKTNSKVDLQWAVKQLLQGLKCGVVLVWSAAPDSTCVRLWQRALHNEGVFALVFSGYVGNEARAYHTRLRLELASHQLRWSVLKRRGGWPVCTSYEPLPMWSSQELRHYANG